VQATHVSHEFVAGTQVEVIGVAQHERGVDVLEMFGCERLDRRLRANRREDRCEQVAVRSGENACAGAVLFGCDMKLKHRWNYTVGATRLGTTDSTLCNGSFSNKMLNCIEGSPLRLCNQTLHAQAEVDSVSRGVISSVLLPAVNWCAKAAYIISTSFYFPNRASPSNLPHLQSLVLFEDLSMYCIEFETGFHRRQVS
jgi:hypothetical protein